jgi:hypothetical protein
VSLVFATHKLQALKFRDDVAKWGGGENCWNDTRCYWGATTRCRSARARVTTGTATAPRNAT